MSPDEHCRRADDLMAKVAEMANPTLAVSRELTAQAAVHAALAQCERPYDYTPYRPLVTRAATGDQL